MTTATPTLPRATGRPSAPTHRETPDPIRTPAVRPRHGALVASLVAGAFALGGCGDAPAPAASAVPTVERDLMAQGVDVEGEWSRMGSIPAAALILEPDGHAGQRVEVPGDAVLRLRGRATHPGVLRVIVYLVDAANGSRNGLVHAARLFVPGEELSGEVSVPAGGPRLVELEYAWTSERGTLRIERALLEEEAPPRPSIVFVSLDTFAARHTSLHGYARQTTPRLDAFAADATVFEHCLSNAAWTTPSYLSQFTGLLPAALRTRSETGATPDPAAPVTWNDWFLADQRWTLAEMLHASGYRTAAFVDNPMVGRAYGVNQGFDLYDTTAMDLEQDEPDGGIRTVVPAALAWLDAQPAGRPFFLFVQANDTHGPYLPPPPFAGRFADDGLSAEPSQARVATIPSVFGQIPTDLAEAACAPDPPPEVMATAPFIAAYDEEILLVDEGLGALFDGLAERGLLEDAIVVISADHGEGMLEHSHYFAHTAIYDEVLHVPLVVRLPGGRGKGRRVTQSVQLVDLYPTLAELVGIPRRPYLHGRSLLPLVDGRELPPAPVLSTEAILRGRSLVFDGWKLVEKEPLLSEVEQTLLSSPIAQRWLRGWIAREAPEVPKDVAMLDVIELLTSNAPEQALRLRAELRHDLQGAFQELYHLDADPLELHDLSDEQPERVAGLLELLHDAQQRAHDARLDVHPPPAFQLTADEMAELRALGYVGSGR